MNRASDRTATKRPVGATVRVGTITAIPRLLKKLGADPARVLAKAGVSERLFDDPDNRLSYEKRSHLLGLCVTATGCRHFGLLLGQEAGLHSFGLVGLLVKYESDVGSALRSLVKYLHLHVRGAGVTLSTDDDAVALGYEIHQSQTEATDQIGDAALAISFNVLSELCGPDWTPVEVRFAHRRPEDVGPFRRFFRSPLQFDAENNSLVFAADWLERPIPGSDPDLRRVLSRQVEALDARQVDDFPDLVRGVLRSALLTSTCGADQVAGLFSMHRRTLHRRLRLHGTNFHLLSDEARQEIARQLLEDTSMGMAQIAAALDYADPSAFSRAFRRWTGIPPARWRAERRG